jgi:hypothetical protein
VKAEMLARESLRIKTKLYGYHHIHAGMGANLLASTLKSQGKLGNETRELFEHSLAVNVKNCGSDSDYSAVANFNLGNFYNDLSNLQQSIGIRKDYLRLSKCKFIEALRIHTKNFGSNSPKALQASDNLSIILNALSRLE